MRVGFGFSNATRRVHAHVRTLQDECLHTFWLTKTCLCVTFNIWHHLFHLTTHICSRNDVPPLDFNLLTLLCIQLWHTKTCLRTLVLLIRRTVFTVKKTSLCATFWLTWTCPHANFLMTGRVCIQPKSCSHTTRRVSAHFLLITKTCLCVTLNIWRHLFHLTTHICSRNDVPPHDFNLRTLLCIQLLTHETMSTNNGFTDSKDSVHCKKTCFYVTFWLTWSCACANFDTRTHVCVQFRT